MDKNSYFNLNFYKNKYPNLVFGKRDDFFVKRYFQSKQISYQSNKELYPYSDKWTKEFNKQSLLEIESICDWVKLQTNTPALKKNVQKNFNLFFKTIEKTIPPNQKNYIEWFLSCEKLTSQEFSSMVDDFFYEHAHKVNNILHKNKKSKIELLYDFQIKNFISIEEFYNDFEIIFGEIFQQFNIKIKAKNLLKSKGLDLIVIDYEIPGRLHYDSSLEFSFNQNHDVDYASYDIKIINNRKKFTGLIKLSNSKISMDDYIVLFHEMGHVLHFDILAYQDLLYVDTACENMLEFPSTLIEYCANEEYLKKFDNYEYLLDLVQFSHSFINYRGTLIIKYYLAWLKNNQLSFDKFKNKIKDPLNNEKTILHFDSILPNGNRLCFMSYFVSRYVMEKKFKKENHSTLLCDMLTQINLMKFEEFCNYYFKN